MNWSNQRIFWNSLTFSAIAALLSIQQLHAQKIINTQPPEDLEVIEDIVIKEVDGQKLDCHLIVPKENRENCPLVIYVHGGGWGNHNKTTIYRRGLLETLRALNDAGFAVATIEYRLSKRDENTVRDLIIDCKDAARFWILNGGEYHIDTTHIGVWGSSAGGHLSLMTLLGDGTDFPGDESLESADLGTLKCALAYYPLTSFVDMSLNPVGNFSRPQRFVSLLGGPLVEKMDLAKLTSPITYAKENDKPILIIHGEEDTVLSIKQAEAFVDEAEKGGAPVDFIPVANAEHGFRGENIEPTEEEIRQATVDFFEKHLGK